MQNPSQPRNFTLQVTEECVEVLNVDKSNFTKNLVLTSKFKVKQLHRPRTQCYTEGDYLLQAIFKDTERLEVNFYRVDNGMTLIEVGSELKEAMQAAINPEALNWLMEYDFIHKQIRKSLETTKLCAMDEIHIDQMNRLFRGLAVPRTLIKCATHHLYAGLPEDLFSNVKVFEENEILVKPERTKFDGGAFQDVSWLVFYGNGKARFINESTTAGDTLPLQNSCMAYKFINDRRPGERFLDIECWVSPI